MKILLQLRGTDGVSQIDASMLLKTFASETIRLNTCLNLFLIWREKNLLKKATINLFSFFHHFSWKKWNNCEIHSKFNLKWLQADPLYRCVPANLVILVIFVHV